MKTELMAQLVAFTVSSICVLACSAGEMLGPTGFARVPEGKWAGERMAMTVDRTGAAVEFECAHGKINGALEVDASGKFDLPGTFVLESGGPLPPGREHPTQRARYQGTLDSNGNIVRLTVRLPDSDNLLVGEFTLERGKDPRFVRCL